MSEHKKNMIKKMQKISYRHNLWTVYADFLEMAALSISNSTDLWNRNKREKKYLEIIKNYTKDEGTLFPELLGDLIMALEEKPSDILGELFMELELGNKWKGQFFTPMSICNMAAQMMMMDIDEKIKEKGYITVNEPACGGGAMIIGVALALQAKKYNYQKQMLVTAVDLDIKSVHMAYIQLSLLGIPAILCHGNTLTVEIFGNWYTPMYILDGWRMKNAKNEKDAK